MAWSALLSTVRSATRKVEVDFYQNQSGKDSAVVYTSSVSCVCVVLITNELDKWGEKLSFCWCAFLRVVKWV